MSGLESLRHTGEGRARPLKQLQMNPFPPLYGTRKGGGTYLPSKQSSRVLAIVLAIYYAYIKLHCYTIYNFPVCAVASAGQPSSQGKIYFKKKPTLSPCLKESQPTVSQQFSAYTAQQPKTNYKITFLLGWEERAGDTLRSFTKGCQG